MGEKKSQNGLLRGTGYGRRAPPDGKGGVKQRRRGERETQGTKRGRNVKAATAEKGRGGEGAQEEEEEGVIFHAFFTYLSCNFHYFHVFFMPP